MNTIQEIEQYAADHGIILSPSDRAKITAVQVSEQKRLQELSPVAESTFADKWNEFYPRLLESIVSAGETLLTFSQTLIVSLGVPVVLVLLLLVEHHRVVEGIMLFDTNSTFAGFAAAALVVLNLLLELQSHHIEHKAGFIESRESRWSLRIWARNMRYTLGLGDDWTEIQLSPAALYKSRLRLVTFTILALALAGSMRAVIEDTPGAWYEALWSIITESNLSLMSTWLGGLLFAAAAVLSAQALSRYVAVRTVEILANMKARKVTHTNPHQIEVERAGALVALAIVNERLEKKATKKGGETQPAPLPAITPVIVEHQPEYSSTNGNGKH
jgi:hypothetical protein